MSAAPSPIVTFYDPATKAPDYKGRTLEGILSWTDHQLEREHDNIQILFPVPEPSPYNQIAPLLDRATFEAFRSRSELRTQIRRSFVRVCAFFGFRMQKENINDPLAILPISAFKDVSATWLKNFNHNHQRMTRIIRCLRILGLEEDAQAFFAALQLVSRNNRGRIGEKSLLYWTRAATRPLHFAPDDEFTTDNRKSFLYEYEKGQRKEIDTTQVGPREPTTRSGHDVIKAKTQKATHPKDETRTKTNGTGKTKEKNKPPSNDRPKKNYTTKTEMKSNEIGQKEETTRSASERRKKPTPKVKQDGVKKKGAGTSPKVQKPRKPKAPPAPPTRTQPRRATQKDVDYTV